MISNIIPANKYCIKIFDGTHETPKPVKYGRPLVTSKNILGGKLNLLDTYNISEKDYQSIQKRSAVSQWDIIFSMIGSIGEVYLEKSADISYAIKNVGVFSCDNEYKAKWLYYYFLSPASKTYIKNYLAGAVQKFLPLGTLREYPILPYNPSEKSAVDLLFALDSKIELNNKINAELEQMAKTFYDFWFVQFDFPDENGKPYKSCGGKMLRNEELKREIPEGWEVGTLLDIADYKNGLPCQKYRPVNKNVLRVIKIKEMHDGYSPETEFVRDDIPSSVVIDNGDILFSWSASLEVQIWSKGRGALNQHIFKVTSDTYPKSFYYFQLLNYLHHFKMMAENRKTTMGHITQEHLQQSRIVLPPKELTIKLETIISPIFSKMITCEIENQQLAELRDWLLPMLMNGQVKVN